MTKKYRGTKEAPELEKEHSKGDLIAITESEEAELPVEMTDRQRKITKLRLRGLSQRAIAQTLNVSQATIAQEAKIIRKLFAEKGKKINRDVVIGESVNLFQEVEHKAWELYHKAQQKDKVGDANKALHTVMAAREKSLRLFMDLGFIERTPVSHEHKVTLPPFMEQWEQQPPQEKEKIIEGIVHSQMKPLPEPRPPEEEIEDAEYREYGEYGEYGEYDKE